MSVDTTVSEEAAVMQKVCAPLFSLLLGRVVCMCHKIPDTEADMLITTETEALSCISASLQSVSGSVSVRKKGALCHLPMPEGVQVSVAPEWLTGLIPHGSLSDMPPWS